MRGFRNGDRGQAGIALIIVIAWALSAVLILTRTLVAAQEINNKVTDITSKLAGAKGDTSYVSQLNKTENTASSILQNAQPLTGQLEIVKNTAAHIQQQVDGITPPVQSINNTLTAIRNTQSSVILTDVVKIKADTSSIITNVHTIDADLCHANYGVALGLLSSGHGGDSGCNNNTIHPLA